MGSANLLNKLMITHCSVRIGNSPTLTRQLCAHVVARFPHSCSNPGSTVGSDHRGIDSHSSVHLSPELIVKSSMPNLNQDLRLDSGKRREPTVAAKGIVLGT